MPQIKEWTEEIFAQLRSQGITLRSKGRVDCDDGKKEKEDVEEETQSNSSLEEGNQSDNSLNEETRVQLEHDAWIQCDRCSKWRKVTKEAAAQYADKEWVCSLNADSKHNSCTDEEETHDERKARKYGLRYICSEIPVGSLVWARLDGFARWPAVLTPDPENGHHLELDEDGDVMWYHVEFLGPKPSHSWCSCNRVEVYSKKDSGTSTTQFAELKAKKKGKKRHRVTAPKPNPTPQQGNLNSALIEADSLMSLNNEQRLQRCHFKWVPGTTDDSETSSLKVCLVKSKPVMESTYCKKLTAEKNKRSAGDKKTSTSSHPTISSATTSTEKHKHQLLPPDLGTCTEKEFRMMVNAFMTSHGKQVSSPPIWNGSKVSLYELFMAVIEKGGYHQITKPGKAGGWAGIYRLLAKCLTSKGGSGYLARKYYERNLLPYEMFLNGCSVEDIQQVMKKPPCKSNSTSDQSTEQHFVEEDSIEDTLDKEMLKMEDMESILVSLDKSIETGTYEAKSDAGGVSQTGAAPLLKFYSDMYDDEVPGNYDLTNSCPMELDTDMSFLPAVEVGVPAAEVEGSEASMMEELEAMEVELEELNTSLGQDLLQL